MSFVCKVHIVWVRAWRLLLSAHHPWSAPNVLSHSGHFVVTKFRLKSTGIEIPDIVHSQPYRAECDHRLGANKSKYGLEHDPSPSTWTKIIGNTRLIYTTACQKWSIWIQCHEDEGESQVSRCSFLQKFFFMNKLLSNQTWLGRSSSAGT